MMAQDNDQVSATLSSINKQMSKDLQFIVVSWFVIGVTSLVLVWLLRKLYKLIKRYVNELMQLKKRKNAALVGQRNQALLNSGFDDFRKMPQREQEENDYRSITSSMNKTFGPYASYNQTLAKHFKDNKKQQAPDKIDKSTLFRENDDWK